METVLELKRYLQKIPNRTSRNRALTGPSTYQQGSVYPKASCPLGKGSALKTQNREVWAKVGKSGKTLHLGHGPRRTGQGQIPGKPLIPQRQGRPSEATERGPRREFLESCVKGSECECECECVWGGGR